jgi:UDPglucose 6-dehydrogenase
MKVAVFGAGYVGLVTAACLADMGNSVHCVDIDAARVAALQRGEVPFHEPGLDELLLRNTRAGRLVFTSDSAAAVAHGTLLFIAVGTPPGADGSADLDHVLAVARSIGRHMGDYKVVVDKSTVPVGTAERVRATIEAALAERGVQLPYAVVSNPEFLKEGAAIEDFLRPDRVVVGCDDEQAGLLMRALYAPFLRNRDRMLMMDVKSAELTKYAANAMLATRISFMNELAALADEVGADIEQVRRGIGSDSRIGTSFLYAGCGYGGSCFPKDVRALVATGAEHGVELSVVAAVQRANEVQRHLLAARTLARFGSDLSGHRFAVWGLAFKPGTDDVREAPARVVIDRLREHGASLALYDPVAMDNAHRQWCGDGSDWSRVAWCGDAMQALDGASALLICTEWREFRSPDFAQMKALLRQPVIFDGRNLYDPADMAALGFEYLGVGRGAGGRKPGAAAGAGSTPARAALAELAAQPPSSPTKPAAALAGPASA